MCGLVCGNGRQLASCYGRFNGREEERDDRLCVARLYRTHGRRRVGPIGGRIRIDDASAQSIESSLQQRGARATKDAPLIVVDRAVLTFAAGRNLLTDANSDVRLQL